MKQLYLDNAATAPVNPKAFVEYVKATNDYIGNPSSPHSEGHKARMALEGAREKIAQLLGCQHRKQIIFTSGGTESNNIALYMPNRVGYEVATSQIEHHSATTGCVTIDSEGFIDERSFEDSLCRTQIASIQYANADIGTIQDIKKLSQICWDIHKGYGEFFTDAVQTVGHIPIDMKKLPHVCSLSASAHKFGGVKGTGFLYMREPMPTLKESFHFIHGGNQEFGLRPGTENVAGAIAMAKALEDSLDNIDYKIRRNRATQKRLIEGLSLIPDSELNGATNLAKRLSNNVSFSFKGIYGDTLVALLDAQYGIIVSAGAACESGNLDGNRIVKAIGKSEELAKGTIRITFDFNNGLTDEETDYVIDAITKSVKELRRKTRR